MNRVKRYLQKKITTAKRVFSEKGIAGIFLVILDKIWNHSSRNKKEANGNKERILNFQRSQDGNGSQEQMVKNGIPFTWIIYGIDCDKDAVEKGAEYFSGICRNEDSAVLLTDDPEIKEKTCGLTTNVLTEPGEAWVKAMVDAARNGKGDYVIAVRPDDRLMKDTLDRLTTELTSKKTEILLSDFLYEPQENDDAQAEIFHAISACGERMGRSICFRKDVFESAAVYPAGSLEGFLTNLTFVTWKRTGSIRTIPCVTMISRTGISEFREDLPSQSLIGRELCGFFAERKIRTNVFWDQEGIHVHRVSGHCPMVSAVIYIPDPAADLESLKIIMAETDYLNLEYLLAVPKEDEKHIRARMGTESVKYITYDRGSTAGRARNDAAKAAKGDWLLFAHYGLEPPKAGWVTELVSTAELYRADGVSPLVLDGSGSLHISSMPILDLDVDIYPKDNAYAAYCARYSKGHVEAASVLSGSCAMIRRSVFEELDGFSAEADADFTDFQELSLRLAGEKRRILCDGRVTVTLKQNEGIPEVQEEKTNFAKLIGKFGKVIQASGLYITGSRRVLLGESAEKEGLYWPDHAANTAAGKSILLVNHELSRTGTPQVMLKASAVLKRTGYFVVAASCEDGPLRNDFLAEGIPVIINRTFAKYRGWEPKKVVPDITPRFSQMLHGFDLVVIASIVGANLITAFQNTNVKILWWIHDGYVGFHLTRKELPEKLSGNISAYCGGGYAMNVMRQFRPQYKANDLLYGVEDHAAGGGSGENTQGKPLFVVPASFEERKNQLTFVRAVASMPREIAQKAEYLLIGKASDQRYFQKLEKEAKRIPNMEVSGPVPYRKLMEIYQRAACIVMPSKDDPMPVVLAEGMMMSKIVICSNKTGTASYIKDGENGFVFVYNRPKELAQKLRYVIENYAALDQLRKKARATYENIFSNTAFARELLKAVEKEMRNGV